MFKTNLKKFLLYFFLVTIIFFLDRVSKLYLINLVEANNVVDIYVSPFLNLYFIWNTGVAFGLLSFEQSTFYSLVTIIIICIDIILLIIIVRSNNYKAFFFICIFGGSLGNLFDRLYYKAVPDFIDIHFQEFHWFIFNVADIFISLGITCLIFVEIFSNKKVTNEIN